MDGAPRRRKPGADIYTVLLILALLALIVGLVCLYLEMAAYEFKLDGGPRVTCTHRSDTLVAQLEKTSTVQLVANLAPKMGYRSRVCLNNGGPLLNFTCPSAVQEALREHSENFSGPFYC